MGDLVTVPATDRVREATATVADHVRALRAAHGWSMQELAHRSGVSKGMVVQVEGGRTNPSIATLCRLADAFGVTAAELLAPGHDRDVQITTADEAPVLWRGGRGGFGRLLTGVHDPALVELWDRRLAPGERYETAGAPSLARELAHLLAGEVTVTVAGTAYPLRAGETVSFPTHRGYALANPAARPARLVCAVISSATAPAPTPRPG